MALLDRFEEGFLGSAASSLQLLYYGAVPSWFVNAAGGGVSWRAAMREDG
jgi:hypothetical protein